MDIAQRTYRCAIFALYSLIYHKEMSSYSFKKRGDTQVGVTQSNDYLNLFLSTYSPYLNFNNMDRKAYFFDKKTVQEQMTLNGSTSESVIIGAWEKNQKFHNINNYTPPTGGLPITFKKGKRWIYGVLFPSPYIPPTPNTFIGGIGSQIANAAALETKLGLASGDVQVYSNNGTDIECYIGVNYTIPNNCFLNNTAITHYHDNGGKVTQIGSSAFRVATKLVSVTFENAANILSQAFKSCVKLESIELVNTQIIGNNAFEGCSLLALADLGGTSQTGDYSFRNCVALATLIADNLVTMGKNAFENCDSLTTVVMDSLTTMGQYAFFGCAILDYISFNSLLVVPTHAFDNSPLIASINLGACITIGSYAFTGNTGLTSISISTVTDIQAFAFYGSHLQDATFNSLLTIGNSAFESNLSLKSFLFDTVVSIGKQAFYGCTLLDSPFNAPSCTSIGTNALYFVQMTNFDAPALISLGAGALTGCTLLTSFQANNLQTIGDYAFANCGLTTINVPNLVSSTQNAFANWSYTGQTIYAPNPIVGTDAGLLQAIADGATVIGI